MSAKTMQESVGATAVDRMVDKESLEQKFEMPDLDVLQRETVKALIMLSPDWPTADKNVTGLLKTLGKEPLVSNDLLDEQTYSYRCFFVENLFKVQKYAACDPDGSEPLDKKRRDYEGLLQFVIDMKWR